MSGAAEMGQGEGTLTKAAALVAAAKQDFDGLSKALEGRISSLQGRWAGAGGTAFLALHRAWTDRQRVITGALDEFEASLTATEKDNLDTDQAQSAAYSTMAGRLG
ncbi:WXG100 family type VII secretion target [Nocardioides soli]|uniref:WXG100 family type VII secretion target n=1 Tax=Nocardioides soli TaxID=1036020 RepID=A0A7W4VVJ0_9ACTN|nr:WXG100 family type VII secretion target [Nocardioides soli]MBB3042520.1 WXG100 family type VII secretion target [Nocardioides soli]